MRSSRCRAKCKILICGIWVAVTGGFSTSGHFYRRPLHATTRTWNNNNLQTPLSRIHAYASSDDSWEPNIDLKGDFELLEDAIKNSRRDHDLKRRVQSAKLDFLAKNRRNLAVDVMMIATFPLIFSSIYTSSLMNGRKVILMSVMFGFTRLMQWTYYCGFCVLPLAMMVFIRMKWNRALTRSKKRVNTTEDPYFSITPAQMVVEGVFSSVACASMVSALGFFSPLVRRTIREAQQRQTFLPLLLSSLVSLINRLGAAASLHQFPGLLFDLEHIGGGNDIFNTGNTLTEGAAEESSGHFLPERFNLFVRRYIQFVNFTLPFGLAADLARVAMFYVLERRVAPLPIHKSVLLVPWVAAVGYITSVFAPMCHLCALKKIIRFHYDDSLSLNEDNVSFDVKNQNLNRQWRWSKLWRQPRTISHVVRGWYYLWAAELHSSKLPPHEDPSSFSIFDYGHDFSKSLSRYGMVRLDGDQPISRSKMKLLELLEGEDNEDESMNDGVIKRSDWIAGAYEEKAGRLEKDFEDKTFYDPLGIAVHKTLGVAMSFNYDHASLSPEGFNPDIHRLRARAAKSAVRRAREIYDPDLAQQQLDNIGDPAKRTEKALEMRRASETEISFIANELKRLVPAGSAEPAGISPIQFEQSGDDTVLTFDHNRVQLSSNLPSIPDPSNVFTNKPEPRTMDIKDEDVEEIIRKEHGQDALDDPIYRRHLLSNSDVQYDQTKSSVSSNVLGALRREAADRLGEAVSDIDDVSTDIEDGQDVYNV